MEEILKLKWLPIVVPFIVGLYNYNKFDKGLKYLFYFVVYGTFNEITYYVLIKSGSKNTLFLGHFYILIAFVLLGIFYKEVFKGFVRGKIISFIIVLFGLYSITNTLLLQSISEYPTLPSSIFQIVFLLASIIFFYKIMVEAKIINLWKEPLIWINCAILLYYSGGLFYSILFNLVLEYSVEFSKMIVRYFALLNALFYIFIAIGFWKAANSKQ